jgi:two-component system, cell cycle response regulator
VDDATLFARLRALLRVKQVQDAWRLRASTARDLGLELPPDPGPDLTGARCLVLGANGEEVTGLGERLAAEGVLATGMTHTEQAWNALTTGNFDLAVLCLPAEGAAKGAAKGEGGREMLRFASRLRAHAHGRDLPVLLVADPGQRELVLRGFDIGANDHVFRPVDPNELRARARNQIRRKHYQERLRADLDRSLEMAVTDPLTGLRNRRYVVRHLEGLLRGDSAAVLLVDVDRFKRINDTHGHAAGDAALRAVAERLKAHLRAADVVARYGGEEFLVVLAGAVPDYALAAAERLRQVLAQDPVAVEGALLSVTASIGVAVAPQGTSSQAATAAADAALYRAKAAGRNRVELAEAADFAAAPASVAP